MTIEDPSLSIYCYQLLPLATSQLMGKIGNLMVEAYFYLFYSLLVEGSLGPLTIHH